jgi:hypothetical protein
VEPESPKSFPDEEEITGALHLTPPKGQGSKFKQDTYCRTCGSKREDQQDEKAEICDHCRTSFVDGELERMLEREERAEELQEEAESDEPLTFAKLDLGAVLHSEELDPVVLPLTIDPVTMRPESLLLNAAWKDESHPDWIRLRTVMDSGAAENVGPPSMAPMVSTLDSPGSLRGTAYLAAGGERIPNLGQQTLNVVTNEGHETQTVYQIAEVTRPLTAVGTTCDKGNIVVYGPGGGCIYHMGSGIQTNFARRGGIYELDLWMKTGQNHGCEQPQGFPWPGR